METQTRINQTENLEPRQSGRTVRIVDIYQELIANRPAEQKQGLITDMFPGRPVRICSQSENP